MNVKRRFKQRCKRCELKVNAMVAYSRRTQSHSLRFAMLREILKDYFFTTITTRLSYSFTTTTTRVGFPVLSKILELAFLFLHNNHSRISCSFTTTTVGFPVPSPPPEWPSYSFTTTRVDFPVPSQPPEFTFQFLHNHQSSLFFSAGMHLTRHLAILI